ncbi:MULTISPECIES: DUF6392 family protein [Pseudomonas]|uniref:Pyocin immunity protein n=1 Tax=Pseudomonas fluorescens NCIMB 11764 TaxID=1221522 RepID=A0A0K1QU98_PSEFL|nr:DUF6392 family protein [Pseudomonas fluorescens]AKV09339.1 hypothetical protein B723_24260 [Pseudomonas fluorescens NCIMB 11764]
MTNTNIEAWIDNLGQSYNDLIALGIVPDQPLKELYPGRDKLHLNPEVGIALSFWAESKQLETVFVTLIKTTPSTVEYKGELPTPYKLALTQSDVHALFGEPMESRGPIKMPQPMGQTGGWEAYPLDPAVHPGKKVVFQYTAAMEVKTLVFTLIDKGHE